MTGLKKGLYRGYSSFEFQRNKSLSLTDIELVKMDILNHIFTPRGSRVMMPEFGSSIPELAFEPLDDTLVDELYSELLTVFDYDPRVNLINMTITPDYETNSAYVKATLKYVELNMTEDFELNIQFEG